MNVLKPHNCSYSDILPRFRFRQVVQQQKAECSQKLEGLSAFLAGAAGLLASHTMGGQTGDVNSLQEKQRKLKVTV